MQDFAERIEQLGCASVADLSGAAPDARLRLAGVVSDFTVRNTKKGDRYAFFRLEDMSGVSVKCVLWPEALKTKGGDAADDRIVLAAGRLDGSSESSQTLVCDEVILLEKARVPTHVPAAGFRNGRTSGKALVIEMPSGASDLATLCDTLTQALVSNPGDCEVFIEMCLPDGLLVRARTNRLIKVFPSQRLQDALTSAGARIRWAEASSLN
jgi:DNA polymerase III subunit alpha